MTTLLARLLFCFGSAISHFCPPLTPARAVVPATTTAWAFPGGGGPISLSTVQLLGLIKVLDTFCAWVVVVDHVQDDATTGADLCMLVLGARVVELAVVGREESVGVRTKCQEI